MTSFVTRRGTTFPGLSPWASILPPWLLWMVSSAFMTTLDQLINMGWELSRAVGVSSGGRASPSYPDERLVADFQGGDRRAFEILVRRYQDRAFSFCLRFLGNRERAEEVAQEAFVRMYEHLGDFRGEASFSSWFYRVMTNHCRNSQRSAARRFDRRHDSIDAPRSEDDERPMELMDPRAGVEEQLREHERQRLLQQALEKLEPDERLILLLREVEGQSYEEVATATGLPLGTVKSRIFRARAALKVQVERLEKGGGDHG